MGKMAQAVKQARSDDTSGRVTNFMGGNSYELNPLQTLHIVTASSIFGEPAYYRDEQFSEARVKDGTYRVDKLLGDVVIRSLDKYKGMSTSDLMEKVIDDALSYDYAGTLEWAGTLRMEFHMRLNPQVIMVRAAMHENRKAFTEANPGAFHRFNMLVMRRADDVISQLTYYLFKNGKKNAVPGILKKSWAKKIESLTPYEVFKYRNHGIGLIDTVRVCHANNDLINELMRTGTVELPSERKTWETLRASGMAWTDIIDQIRMPHMALLRNLRGIFSETYDSDLCHRLMGQLIDTVATGKQFPFRYMSALHAVDSGDVPSDVKADIEIGLNACLDKSCTNLPRLRGRSAFLSDNSGSAWGACTSEYGSACIAEIGNLSSVIGAVNSDEGHVYAFGDKLKEYALNVQGGILSQARVMSKDASQSVGQATENGIWLFFRDALENKEWWDNIFIYSDQQAGHGGLYGMNKDIASFGASVPSRSFSDQSYIDVAKLVQMYREKVNPKVNVYCIQTAGYNNVLVPENGYRTNVLYGWTGRELVYADMMNRFWDGYDHVDA